MRCKIERCLLENLFMTRLGPNCLLKMVLVACTISVQKSISCVLSIHHFTYFYCTSQYKVQHIVLLFLYEFFNFQFCDFLVNMGVDDKKLFFIIFSAKALWHCLTSCQFDLILDVWTSSKIWRLYIWTCEMLSLFSYSHPLSFLQN